MRGTAKYVCFECRTYRRGVKHGVMLRCRTCSSEIVKVPNATKVPSPKNIKDWKSLQEDIINRKARRYNPTDISIKLCYNHTLNKELKNDYSTKPCYKFQQTMLQS